MNYKKHYNSLINRAKERLLESYGEKHHIIPRCMDGSDDVKNLVVLTPEEHYVAHQLLIKIYPDELKLVYAARMMSVGSPKQSRNNKLYGWLRRKHAKIVSENMKGSIPWNKGLKTGPQSTEQRRKHSDCMKGKGNPMYGIPITEERRKNISESKKGQIPWNKGKTTPKEVRRKQSVTHKKRKNSLKERNASRI